MAKINSNYNKLPKSYLFSEIAKRIEVFSKKNPRVKVMKLGIGNTTEELSPVVIAGLRRGVTKLSSVKTYSGYGDEQGDIRLRHSLSGWYKKRNVFLDPEEIFISDGAKSDGANITSIFARRSTIAVCDPSYPVYVDSNVIYGNKIFYMKCSENKGFIPELPRARADVIFLCSPNNPTGAVMTKGDLKKFVDFALRNNAVVIFDAAYFPYVKDKKLPRSIYEIAGAKKCAIEINSFSKWAGFTGVRLGWTIVPKELTLKSTKKCEINNLWRRRQTTMFNGASNIAQEGGLAVLSSKGQTEAQKMVDYYMGNAKIIKKGLNKKGLTVLGGENAPYLWVKAPNKMKSWDFFDKLLTEAHVVGTPGSGFGPAGEGYLRLSAFGHRKDIIDAIKSIEVNLNINEK